MKKNKDENNTTGYIEGYYGNLLSWENRKLIISSLQKNNMNTYFYAPKEDEYHRLNWRKKYDLEWRKNFRNFTKFSKKNNINVIAGIAPGLDFDFNKFNDKTNYKDNIDYIIVINGYNYDKTIQFPNLPNLTILKRENVGYDFGGHNHALEYIEKIHIAKLL